MDEKPSAINSDLTSYNDDEFYLCKVYEDDIFVYLMESEKRQCYTLRCNFMEHQVKITIINCRVFVNCLIKLHDKMRMVHHTLFLCVDIIDRYGLFLLANTLLSK